MSSATPPSLTVAAVVFPGFELLDLFGPYELLWIAGAQFQIEVVAEQLGPITSAQGATVLANAAFSDAIPYDVLLVPGGRGTRREVENPALLDWLRRNEPTASYVTSVCTGSALLARAGLLDGRRATSNKLAFDWVVTQGPHVHWVREARWVEEGKFFTSSGVSAGMDMTLALIERIHGADTRATAARRAEYTWNSDSTHDPFARVAGS